MGTDFPRSEVIFNFKRMPGMMENFLWIEEIKGGTLPDNISTLFIIDEEFPTRVLERR